MSLVILRADDGTEASTNDPAVANFVGGLLRASLLRSSEAAEAERRFFERSSTEV